MTYDLNYVKAQVRRVIDTAPTHVQITREGFIPDGYGGRIKQPNQVVKSDLRVLFDNASSPNLTIGVSDAGRVFTENSIRLFVLYEQDLVIKRDDIVKIMASGRRFKVTEVNNILEQNILLEVKLEVKD